MNLLRASVLGLTMLRTSCSPAPTSWPISAEELQSAVVVPQFSDLETAILTRDQMSTKRHAEEGDTFYMRFWGLIDSYSMTQSTQLGSDWWLQRTQMWIQSMKANPDNLTDDKTARRIHAAEEFTAIGEEGKHEGYLDAMAQFVMSLTAQANLTQRLYGSIVSDIEMGRSPYETYFISQMYRRDVEEAIALKGQANQGYDALPDKLKSKLQVWFGKYVTAPLVQEPLFRRMETNAQFEVIGEAAIEGVLNTIYHRE